LRELKQQRPAVLYTAGLCCISLSFVPGGEALLLTSPVRKLRNRIAHHEPILNRNLEDDFATIKRIIAYRCQHSLEWMLKNQVLLPLLTLKPL
jgi:hypothetical protein